MYIDIIFLKDCLVNDRSRPLLLITDRISDLFPVLQHASTYQVCTVTVYCAYIYAIYCMYIIAFVVV